MTHGVGLLVRSYAGKDIRAFDDFDEVVKRAVATARKALALKEENGKPVFHRVLFVVPFDYDRWGTAPRLTAAFQEAKVNAAVMTAVGHHSREALNRGIERLAELGCDRACIFSNKAIEYLNAETMRRVSDECAFGSLVVGVRLRDLDDVQVIPLQNTFAVWDIDALQSVGGFDSDTGVEEIAPLVRIVQQYGRCASVIKGSAPAAFKVRESADGRARHAHVRDTKRARQNAEAERLGVTMEWLRGRLIDDAPVVT